MEILVLDAQIRDVKTKVSALRKQKLIPAVCYGKGFQNRVLQVDYQAFRRAFKAASTTQVVTLNVAGEKVPVLIHEIKYNPMSDSYEHIDFLQIDMKKKVDATVPVVVTGVSGAVKNFNGVLTIVKHEIEVRCLPMDIPHEFVVDVAALENLGDAIHIRDLKLSDKVEVLDDMDETLVSVNAVAEYEEKAAEVPEDLKAEPAATEKAEGTEKKEA